MTGIIYKATNTLNGQVYIGQTITSLANRRKQHLDDARHNYINAFHLAIARYGASNFEWETIDKFKGDKAEVIHALNVAEEYHILKFQSNNEKYGYNSTAGGYSSDKFADHIKRRMAIEQGAKRILQYSLDGDFIREYESLNDVAREMGKDKAYNASELCRGSHYGYQWRVCKGISYQKKIAAYVLAGTPTKEIAIYDTHGDLQQIVPSLKEAKAITGINQPKAFGTMVQVNEWARPDFILMYTEGRIPMEHISVQVKLKKRKRPAQFSNNKVSVIAYDLEGNKIREFESLAAAADFAGTGETHIKAACKDERNTIRNRTQKYFWRFKTENAPERIGVRKCTPKVYKPTKEHRIIQYDKDGQLIKVWKNRYTVLKELHINTTRDTDYIWRPYTEDYEERIQVSTPKMHYLSPVSSVIRERYRKPVIKVTIKKVKTIYELDVNNNIINTYQDSADASKKLGLSQSYICNVLAGRIRKPKVILRREDKNIKKIKSQKFGLLGPE